MSQSIYSVIWTKTALKQLNQLDNPIKEAIVKKTRALGTNDAPLDIKKLVGFENLYRLRVGDYRIVFRPNHVDKQYIIAEVAHRKDIYRSFSISNLPRA